VYKCPKEVSAGKRIILPSLLLELCAFASGIENPRKPVSQYPIDYTQVGNSRKIDVPGMMENISLDLMFFPGRITDTRQVQFWGLQEKQSETRLRRQGTTLAGLRNDAKTS